ncbi:MAG: hypothetical protein JKX84_08465, partial [Flavobacteriales bacterium]|nr:hypothetical protein [Flavobacteriales bacterium]
VWEKGIRKAPNFAENYFWAAKLMKASRNHLWVWIYAETFFNMVENSELKRSAAKLSSFASATVLEDKWNADPEKMDQDLKVALLQNCSSLKGGQSIPLEKITCLLKNWDYKKYSAAPLFNRMKNLEKRGWLEAYLASILQETDKEKFLRWLVNNAKTYEEYRKWSYWNRLELLEAINRLLE